MFSRNYYCLVAGLRDYSFDSEVKGFDAPAIIEEIKEGVSSRDRRTVELFYSYYDIENIIYIRAGREQFSSLGNFSREELLAEMESPENLPPYMAHVIVAFNEAEKEGSDADVPEDIDAQSTLEHNLFEAYYRECSRSPSSFLRDWAEFDRNQKNIAAAVAARRRGVQASEILVGDGDVVGSLARSSAADFGLKGEVGYIDQIISAVTDSGNLVEKERKLDALRWETADELTALNYFDLNYLLAHLVKVNIIHRWMVLDPEKGRQMLKKLIDSLTGSEVVNLGGESNSDNKSDK